MRHGVHLGAAGHATSLFLAITFVLCVGFDLLFPHLAMYQAWQISQDRIWAGFCESELDGTGRLLSMNPTAQGDARAWNPRSSHGCVTRPR